MAQVTDGALVRLDTLPDLVRRARSMCEEIGADEFVLMHVAARSDRRRITPCIDSSYPGLSDTSRLLAAKFGDRFVRRMLGSTIPCRWAGTQAARDRAPMDALFWTDTIAAPDPASCGIALPLVAQQGHAGAMIFTGGNISSDMHLLADIHGRCFSLFSVVSRLRPPPGSRSPQITRRELECLRLTAEGHTSEQIAERLGLSVHTANQYLASSGRKLNADNRMHAVAKALRSGLID